MTWLPESEVKPPELVRHWKTGSLWPKLGPVSSMNASAAPALVSARIITPAFVQKSGLLILTTRATISPSPDSGLYTDWKEAATSQMALPGAVTQDGPTPAKVALPGKT